MYNICSKKFYKVCVQIHRYHANIHERATSLHNNGREAVRMRPPVRPSILAQCVCAYVMAHVHVLEADLFSRRVCRF